MKGAYRSVMFFIGQKELESQYKLNKIVGQCRQKCEAMQEKFTEKLEQLHTAYQKLSKRCQMLEQELECVSKDKQELQEKFAEKSRSILLFVVLLIEPQKSGKQKKGMYRSAMHSQLFYFLNLWLRCKASKSNQLLPNTRQKRKLDEMYDQLRSENESLKRSAIQPASNFFQRVEPELFSSPANMMDNRDHLRQDRSVFTPETPGPREDLWHSARQKNSNSGPFDVSGGSPARPGPVPGDASNRRATRPIFGAGPSNPSATLRNLIFSPMKRPQLSRNRPHMFT